MERYAGYRETVVPDMFRLMNSGAAYIAGAMPRDEQKWGVRFEQGFVQLSTWLHSRLEWLDGQWLEGEAIDLDFALNTEGGHLDFNSAGSYPFTGVIKDGRVAAVSGNVGANSSTSEVTLTLDMAQGETLSFDYKVSSESGYDIFTFRVNGSTVLSKDGEHDWANYVYTAPSAGTYEFSWRYSKDYSVANGSDCVWLDEVVWSGDELGGLLGDVDGNGEVNANDALLLMRFNMNSIDSVPCIGNADFDGSGSVDANDALAIMRFAMSVN